jgi:hypothetical protein
MGQGPPSGAAEGGIPSWLMEQGAAPVGGFGWAWQILIATSSKAL